MAPPRYRLGYLRRRHKTRCGRGLDLLQSLTWRSSVLQTLSLIVVGIGALFSLLFHIGTKENSSFQRLPETDDENGDPHKQLSGGPEPLLLWKHWLLEPSFYQVHCAYINVVAVMSLCRVLLSPDSLVAGGAPVHVHAAHSELVAGLYRRLLGLFLASSKGKT